MKFVRFRHKFRYNLYVHRMLCRSQDRDLQFTNINLHSLCSKTKHVYDIADSETNSRKLFLVNKDGLRHNNSRSFWKKRSKITFRNCNTIAIA